MCSSRPWSRPRSSFRPPPRCRAADRHRAHRRPPDRPARARRRAPGARLDARRRRPRAHAVGVPGDRRPRTAPTSGTAARCTPPPRPNVPYGGPALRPGTRYTWKVRAWDESGQPSDRRARPQSLETGLLTQRDWKAKWIGAAASDLDLNGDRWIWYTNDDAVNNLPAMTRFLRATVNLPTAPEPGPLPVHRRRRGRRLRQRHAGDRHQDPARHRRERLAEGAAARRHSLLHAGANTLAVQVKNRLEPERRRRRPAASSPA